MKWFITDMDGTFLNDKKEVAPNAQDVVSLLQLLEDLILQLNIIIIIQV